MHVNDGMLVGSQNDGPSEALRLVAARTPDGVSSEVTLEAAWRPPVVTLFVPDGVTLAVTATARSVLQ
ncbi:MAG: hypothetical protein ACXIUP_04235 [Microcella sp.]